MAILYKNIRNGKEVLLSASQYELHIADPNVFEQDFFKGHMDLIEHYSKKPYVNGTILYTIKYKAIERPCCILWGPLKNSGTQGVERKRIQVLPSVMLKDETPYFAIGAYNTIDTRLYTIVLGGVREFIKHAQAGRSYSSLWIDYSSMWDAYKFGNQDWCDTKGRDILACRADNIVKIHDAIINLLTAFGYGSQKTAPQSVSDDPMALIDVTDEINKYHDDSSLPRNPVFREMALERENYTCELCGTHKTFTDKNNEEYFEGHHLIMYNISVQRRFKYCLDHPSNIICLCPTCHRKIHHASVHDTQEMIIRLFTKHDDLLKSYSITSLKEILNDYTK